MAGKASATNMTAAAQSAPFAPGVHDVALAELSDDAREWLQQSSLPWFNSLGFCTIYNSPAADRVWFQANEHGHAIHAVFYRERRFAGVLKILEGVGFTDCADSDILALLRLRKAALAVVNRMLDSGANKPSRGWLAVTHDVIVALPDSKDEYLTSLGKHKRQQMPYYWRRLHREFNEQVRFAARPGKEIALNDIVRLVRFNQTRMENLGKSNETQAEIARQERRWPLTVAQGLLCTIESGERVLGGTFNYVHGDEAFLIVIAHDPNVERLDLGNVGLWKTAEHLIERGIRRYHLLWGKKFYKTQFGGRDHPIFMQIISPHPWLVPLWTAHVWFWRQAPRAFRFLWSRAGNLLGRRQQGPSNGDTD
jgi:hypothetical protein